MGTDQSPNTCRCSLSLSLPAVSFRVHRMDLQNVAQAFPRETQIEGPVGHRYVLPLQENCLSVPANPLVRCRTGKCSDNSSQDEQRTRSKKQRVESIVVVGHGDLDKAPAPDQEKFIRSPITPWALTSFWPDLCAREAAVALVSHGSSGRPELAVHSLAHSQWRVGSLVSGQRPRRSRWVLGRAVTAAVVWLSLRSRPLGRIRRRCLSDTYKKHPFIEMLCRKPPFQLRGCPQLYLWGGGCRMEALYDSGSDVAQVRSRSWALAFHDFDPGRDRQIEQLRNV